MTSDRRPPSTGPRPGRSSPTAWIVGVILVAAVLVTLVFYNGRDLNSTRTVGDPAAAPNVVTGKNSQQK